MLSLNRSLSLSAFSEAGVKGIGKSLAATHAASASAVGARGTGVGGSEGRGARVVFCTEGLAGEAACPRALSANVHSLTIS